MFRLTCFASSCALKPIMVQACSVHAPPIMPDCGRVEIQMEMGLDRASDNRPRDKAMTGNHKEYMGVHYWLSATSTGSEGWYGEANVRYIDGDNLSYKIIKTTGRHRSSHDAMTAAEEQLKAMHFRRELELILQGPIS